MNVSVSVWLELTKDERYECLKFAAWNNAKRKSASLAGN